MITIAVNQTDTVLFTAAEMPIEGTLYSDKRVVCVTLPGVGTFHALEDNPPNGAEWLNVDTGEIVKMKFSWLKRERQRG